MTRLTATLGTSGLAAILLLGAVQLLPPRDGGTAQAGTEAAAARAWADPPRSPTARPAEASALPVAGTARAAPPVEAPQVASLPVAAPPAAQAAPDARPETRSRRAMRRDRAHVRLAARRRPADARPAPQQEARAAQGPVVRTASARMGGPVGDILHGLGLD